VTVVPRPAATVVLVRDGSRGPEVLLVRRPPTMAFAPDVHVFPGGGVDAADRSVEAAALRELDEEVGIALPGADVLVPLSRWVTPAGYPRRFDVRFFAAALPTGARVSLATDEVADHRWIRPADALAALARGELPMWLPTTVTLQQLAYAASFGDLRTHLAADLESPARPPAVERVGDAILRFTFVSAGSVPGQTANGYVVGRRDLLVIDPGDPSEAALDAIVDAGRVRAIALTHVDPDHAAGAQALAERLDVPVLVGPGGGRPLPFPVVELADGPVPVDVDVTVRAIATPGPRPDHVAFAVGEGAILAGDLVGGRAARAILQPPDEGAWRGSLDRLGREGARLLLPGHGDPVTPGAGPPPGSGAG
jgi:glyoxylase-like metal-dependent hydrolase (beta-lactamase superfamily II)/8-oxo-dGTP pyrophosphatase MutT (NUDIX family)